MNVETIITDVKTRGEVVVARGQDVVESGFETLKAANAIVVEGVKSLVDTNVAAGKDLLAVAQSSFSKAKTDGVKAVAANPVAYLPEGKDRVVAAYTDSVAVVTKTSDELVKTIKAGYETISAKIAGEDVGTVVAEAAAEAKKTVKKTVSKAKKAVKA
ncbi:phasin family protein [Solimonas sp. SE-A11]|uniref:phasin family protein n=1 Tax=Solimonas sp. SE-A11 TaxID=3054954 RepID=UPI00259D267C|nr:phasin family protein [Solimonas sp. SE-A11]MDM4770819.1 phasin family protein [Solimonas sp. SE-A11]